MKGLLYIKLSAPHTSIKTTGAFLCCLHWLETESHDNTDFKLLITIYTLKLTIFSKCRPASYFMNHKTNVAKCLLTVAIWSHQVQNTALYIIKVNFCGQLNSMSNNSSTNTE